MRITEMSEERIAQYIYLFVDRICFYCETTGTRKEAIKNFRYRLHKHLSSQNAGKWTPSLKKCSDDAKIFTNKEEFDAALSSLKGQKVKLP